MQVSATQPARAGIEYIMILRGRTIDFESADFHDRSSRWNQAQTRLAFIATKANASFVNGPPRNILMLKGHSAGIGDLLRSSAAWRALRDRFPESRLHLWFLTRNPASASSELIARHHLLASLLVSDKRASDTKSWKDLLRNGRELVQQVRPDLIVDFEPNGFRTSLLS